MSDPPDATPTNPVRTAANPDDRQGPYTTTPPEDRVGSSDQGKYEPVEVPPAREVTGLFDHLATRDVAAMEHELQTPEFVGAETVAPLGGEGSLLDTVVPSAGVGVGISAADATHRRSADAEQNPNYKPPSTLGPPHLGERPADLRSGEKAELENEVQGKGSDHR